MNNLGKTSLLRIRGHRHVAVSKVGNRFGLVQFVSLFFSEARSIQGLLEANLPLVFRRIRFGEQMVSSQAQTSQHVSRLLANAHQHCFQFLANLLEHASASSQYATI